MASNAYTILTNNPKVQAKYPENTNLLNSAATDVLAAARNAIHKGAVLLTHPLSGGSVPSMNPYKSIIISEPNKQLDFMSNKLIEEAIMFYKKNARIKYKAYNDKLIDDFQTLDLDLMVSAITSMEYE